MTGIIGSIRKAMVGYGPTAEAEKTLIDLGMPYEHRPGGDLLVRGNLALNGRGIKSLPDLSCVIVTGYFDCSNNLLSSLKGAPQKIFGSFICKNNRLITLEHGPTAVGGDYACQNNSLVSLGGAPTSVGGTFNCRHNNLSTLAQGPASVGKSYICSDNKLETLQGAPSTGVDFDCQANPLESLQGAPRRLKGSFNCSATRIPSLEGCPESFEKMYSDFGAFHSWAEVPVELKGRGEPAVSIEKAVKVMRPLKIKNQINTSD